MTAFQLPAKLKKEPLADAIFEIRFASAIPGSNIIPGALASRLLPDDLKFERLPASDIPSSIRDINPALRSQPLMRMHWKERFFILIGDTALSLACKLPYPGWKGEEGFKSHILKLIDHVTESGLIQSIERYSLKYTGVIDGKDIAEQIGRLKVDLRLGDLRLGERGNLRPGEYRLKAEPFSIRVEIQDGETLHVVQLASPASVTSSDGTARTGILVDIDGLCEHKTSDLKLFRSELPDRVERLHARDKERFFGLLTPETLAYLEPIYDQEPN
jgi:uncharacterized protein (TIGR04255 family)